MKQIPFAAALCVGLSLLAVEPREASAQDRRGRDQVCVYEHADYGGFEQCYGVGGERP